MRNEERSSSKTDTDLTRPRSGPVRYELIDKDGKTHGPFNNLKATWKYAETHFSGQEQDEDRTGNGWDVQIINFAP